MTYHLAAAAAALIVGVAPALAAVAPVNQMAPQSIIMAGPNHDDDSTKDATNLHIYLSEVCPAVRVNESAYSATLVRFCNEWHG